MGVSLIVMAAISIAASAYSGVQQYKSAKANIKSAEQQQEMNAKATARNQELLEKSKKDAQIDQGRKQRLETGAAEAHFAGSGLSSTFGSPLGVLIGNEIAQQQDVVRLNSKYEDAKLSEEMALNNANYNLDVQIQGFKQQKTAAIVNTVSKIASTAASAAGGASGGGASGGASSLNNTQKSIAGIQSTTGTTGQ